MRFCVSGDSCVWAPFLLSQAHLTIWGWGRLHAGVDAVSTHVPGICLCGVWEVGHGGTCLAVASWPGEQELRVLAMGESWPPLKVHVGRGVWV